jgi:hypothetical protein
MRAANLPPAKEFFFSCQALACPARAEASRKNGAKSRGPKTSEGKARSARNALRHGLRAQKYVVLPDEDAAEFAALEAALTEELAPAGVLQSVLVQRIAAAAWRLSRAEQLETELFAENGLPDGTLGLALIRDGNRAGAFGTLLRYRGGALAEFWRALRTLKALQAEVAAPRAEAHATARDLAPAPAPTAQPDKPKHRRNPRDCATDQADLCDAALAGHRAGARLLPIEARRTPPNAALLLVGTALVPAGPGPLLKPPARAASFSGGSLPGQPMPVADLP